MLILPINSYEKRTAGDMPESYKNSLSKSKVADASGSY